MNTIDGRCFCTKCEARTTDAYRMVGACRNCRANPVLMIFRSGDKVRPLDCRVCRCWGTVHAARLATADEVPAA